ncbi:MAG TPA: serine--tRNA ligase, partial [Anaerolineae bacterium]|nr:serine--tRNA ligase [Anaerolineae bacterium]
MLDLNLIREHADEVKEALVKLNSDAPIDAILQYDAERRELLQEVELLREERNRVSKEIGRMKDKEARQAKIAEMRFVGDRIGGLDERLRAVEHSLQEALLWVPNLPHPSVPVGPDESHNILLRTEGTVREFDFEPLPHWDLGETLDIIDFEREVKLSGSRFYVLKGPGAQL